MEPQLIDYYHEMPHGIHVIDKMNDELADLQNKYGALEKKYDELDKKINKFKAPYIVVDTVEEYKTYDNIICNHFEQKIRDFLRDDETGLFALIKMQTTSIPPDTLLDCFRCGKNEYLYVKKMETCKDKIINELDDITNNKNKEWCELRIDIAFETCLKDKPALRYKSIAEEDLIVDLIHHIYNDVSCDYLPTIYIDTCSEYSKCFSDRENALYDLVSYKCKKCSTLAHGKENLLCWYCE